MYSSILFVNLNISLGGGESIIFWVLHAVIVFDPFLISSHNRFKERVYLITFYKSIISDKGFANENSIRVMFFFSSSVNWCVTPKSSESGFL